MEKAPRVSKAQVRRMCQKMGLSSQQLADLIGVTKSAVDKWRSRRSRRVPGADSSAALKELWEGLIE